MSEISGSIAVWCKPANGAQSEIEAHFNYWHMTGDAQFKPTDGSKAVDFIEIGVLLDDPWTVEAIKIYLPIKVDRSSIEDCSTYFQEVSIAQGIFNEVLATAGPKAIGPKFIELSRGGGHTFARVHEFALDGKSLCRQEVLLEDKGDGTIITISEVALKEARDAATSSGRSYFRLRAYFRNGQSNPFIRTISTPDKLLQSSYDEIEYLDFRVNEARTLPDTIEQAMRIDRRIGEVKVKLIAFLTAVPVKSDLTTQSSQSHKMRLLEHKLWKNYVRGEIPIGMMVYHWKREAQRTHAGSASVAQEVTDFTAFVKLSTKRASKKIWLAYLIVTFLIGLLGNLLAGYIQNIIANRDISRSVQTMPSVNDGSRASAEADANTSAPGTVPTAKNMIKSGE
ncbi:hypothetical protein [Asticcacaulis excentricus]|uniref:Uncharacterized protein n=1 Tax=Asticcacaulis excentricus (strain ATCC 15261 / DSM 4724 / KCTC 12464 / NCIMB 9791 / VKM B-1370 / CB 48) TaxID=573065 RepID=E8RPY2_ASTEC|nr:hypothetical protein [Asticcacaulis excentricus]ADU13155.1 hypothetical protein Astex_1489 [Asticcacaulis excentricus CB 48]